MKGLKIKQNMKPEKVGMGWLSLIFDIWVFEMRI